MKRIVIDTNVVLSFLTDRDLRQQVIAAGLLEGAASGLHQLVLHQLVITETVYVLRNLYQQTPAVTAAVVRDLIDMPGIAVVDEMPWARLFEIWPHQSNSYADSAIAALAGSGEYDSVATFDRDLRKLLRKLNVQVMPDKL